MKLIEAIEKGDIEAVKQHIAAGTDVNAKDRYGATPLHIATHLGHKETVELLIANGADVNAKDDNGCTPVSLAEGGKHTETADLLRKHGGIERRLTDVHGHVIHEVLS